MSVAWIPLLPGADEALDASGAVVADPATGGHQVSWFGAVGNTYFLQVSDNLADWQYFPIVVAGEDALIEWGVVRPGRKNFVRVIRVERSSADPQGDDFDLDAVSNLDELRNGTDPLGSTDADADGLPDDWERAHGLDPGSAGDAGSDVDGDGLTALEEFAYRADPQRRDSDGDGLLDGYEALKGTPLTSGAGVQSIPGEKTGLLVYCPALPAMSGGE